MHKDNGVRCGRTNEGGKEGWVLNLSKGVVPRETCLQHRESKTVQKYRKLESNIWSDLEMYVLMRYLI